MEVRLVEKTKETLSTPEAKGAAFAIAFTGLLLAARQLKKRQDRIQVTEPSEPEPHVYLPKLKGK